MTSSGWQHVYWMGGSPCSGKSSMSKLLGEQYGLQVYHVDEAYQRLARQVTPSQPNLYKWETSSWDEMWMQSPQDLLRGTIAAYREQLALVLADLQELGALQSDSTAWLVEGTSLLPDALANIGIDPQQAIWIVPEEAFQRHYYARRGDWLQGILSTCRDPQQAFENWMNRDAAFARWVREQARQRGLFLLEVDGRFSIPENAAIVAGHFGLASPQAGPASA